MKLITGSDTNYWDKNETGARGKIERGCKKIMKIGLQNIQLRRDKRLHENKEWNTELNTANLRILLDLTTFLHWICWWTSYRDSFFFSSLCPFTKPFGGYL